MKKKPTKDTPSALKRAICARRGGHENTSEAGILSILGSMDAETRKEIADEVAGNAPTIDSKTPPVSKVKPPQDEDEADGVAKGVA